MPVTPADDPLESRVLSLFDEWTARRVAGDPATPTDLCPEDGELRRRLTDRIAAFDRVERMFGGSAPSERPPPATVAPAGFVIDQELGHGGMGVVYRATQSAIGRTVALKMIAGGRVRSRRDAIRFQAEASAVAAVSHRNVVQLFEYGDDGGHPFLVMEFCPGGTLADKLDAGALSPAAAATLVANLADGVQAAHDCGIVHRDLKPGNVLFAADGTAKVADFGLAKTASSEQTQTGTVVGSPAYMSPEQANGQTKFIGPAADVWSLGVILYECLTGRRPFRGEDSWLILQQVRSAEPPGVRSHIPGLPRDLERVCAKCLRKEPHERYPTAAALADDLRAWAAGKPVSARPVPFLVRTWKWVRRNPLPAAAVLAGLFAAAAGVYALDADRRAANAATATANAVAATANANEQLATERANRVEKEQQAARDGYRTGTQLLIAQGAVLKAVEFADQAEKDGVPLTPEMRLERVRALVAVSQSDRARDELKRLEGGMLSPELTAQVNLFAGDFAIGMDDAEAERRIRRAKESGLLPTADRAYADGLLAKTTPEVVGHLQKALEVNPRHLGARTLLSFTLLTLGRLEEASRLSAESRLLYPEHPHFPVIQAMSSGLAGDETGLNAALAAPALAAAFPGNSFAEFEESCRLLPALSGELRAAVYGDDTLRHEIAKKIDLNARAQKLAAAYQTAVILPLTDKVPAVRAQLPPSCRGAFERLHGILASIGKTMGAGQPPASVVPQGQLDKLGEALKGHPEGLAAYVYAVGMMERAKTPGGGTPDDYRAALARAGQAAITAAKTPSILPATRELAFDQAAMCYALAGKPVWSPMIKKEWVDAATDAVQRRMQVGAVHSSQIVVAIKAARNAKNWTLARILLDEWEAKAKDNPAALQLRAEIEFGAEAHKPALAAAEAVLRLTPADAGMALIRDECRRVLGLPAVAPLPRLIKGDK